MVREVFGDHEVNLAVPVIQPAILPASVRSQMREHPRFLSQLRNAAAGPVPEQMMPSVQLERFSVKSVAMAVIGVAAIIIVLGSLNLDTVMQALRSANPWWILAAFGFGLLTYVGAALPLVAFTPGRLSLWEAILVQVSASVVTLVAPAGLGPVALNLRYLHQRRIDTPLALAVVAFVQFAQFITTVVLLVLLVVITGRSYGIEMPSVRIFIIVAIILIFVAASCAIPWVRRQLVEKIRTIGGQIWQRAVWVVGHPRRLFLGLAGNALMVVSFVAAFGASLAACGYSLDITTLTVTYLASNSLGSVIPSPGGIGPVEAALTGGLTVAGIPSGIALSAAVLYRLVTFYGRAPLGWIALRVLQRLDLI